MTWGPTNPGQIAGQSGPVPLVTEPSFPASGTFVQNTNPYPVQAHIKIPAAVTVQHLYLNKVTGTTGAVDIGANYAATTALNFTIMIPAGWWFALTYSGGTVTWTWAGGY